MRESPRFRRLRSDFRSLVALRSESSIFQFECAGDPPESYTIRFFGRGFWRNEHDVVLRDMHEVSVGLGANYPRMGPELAWRTPIYHPNISASGVVCLGGYGTHWVPSVGLDELCVMLWDMIRYQNFDVESPYNRDAASWARTQTTFRLPIDDRPLRDRVASQPRQAPATQSSEVMFLENGADEVVDAELIESDDNDILFIE